MADQGLSLGGLLDHEELGLRLVVGDEECRERPVVGVHCTEIRNPSRWLEPGWVMLTNGMRLGGDEEEQRLLVAELDEAGLSALGFGVQMIHDEIPPGLVSEARRRGFPLFEVPLPTPFSSVSAFAAGSVASRDFYVLRRIVSMRDHLMNSLDAEQPACELVVRLAKMLDSTVVLYRPDGRVELAVGPGEQPKRTAPSWSRGVWTEVCAREVGLCSFEHEDLKVVSAPVEVGGRPRHWLVVVTRQAYTFEYLTRPMVEAAVRLHAVIATAQRIAGAEERAQQADLIERIAAAGLDDAEELGRRAAALGLDFAAPTLAFQVVGAKGGEEGLSALATELERRFAGAHLPLLLALREDRVVCLAQVAVGELGALVEGLETGGAAAAIGVGRPAGSIPELGCSAADAALAVEQLRGQGGGILHFEDLKLTTWLMTHPETTAVAAKVEQTLSAVKEKPQLYETLRCYLDHDLDVIAAAKALNLHANSLRYRLTKIEELLGASLRRPATISDLYLAITLDTLAAGGVEAEAPQRQAS
ncbi:MAG: PucR family transcriptional regulator ligand-binding domain-containing protein [Solirubrobacterales bacterium]